MNDHTLYKVKSGGWISMIERAWEISWATRLTFMAVFTDIALLMTGQPGLIGWAQREQPTVTLGWLITTGVALCLVVAILIPAVLFFLKQITIQITYFFVRFISTDREIYRGSGYVYEKRLLDHALKKRSQFLLNYYNSEHVRKKNSRDSETSLSDLLASLLILVGFEAWWGVKNDAEISLVEAFWAWNSLSKAVLLISIFFSMIFVVNVWTSYRPIYIYYPPLFDELEKKRAEKRNLNRF